MSQPQLGAHIEHCERTMERKCSQPNLNYVEFDIEIDIISYEESLFMGKTLQRAYS